MLILYIVHYIYIAYTAYTLTTSRLGWSVDDKGPKAFGSCPLTIPAFPSAEQGKPGNCEDRQRSDGSFGDWYL